MKKNMGSMGSERFPGLTRLLVNWLNSSLISYDKPHLIPITAILFDTILGLQLHRFLSLLLSLSNICHCHNHIIVATIYFSYDYHPYIKMSHISTVPCLGTKKTARFSPSDQPMVHLRRNHHSSHSSCNVWMMGGEPQDFMVQYYNKKGGFDGNFSWYINDVLYINLYNMI